MRKFGFGPASENERIVFGAQRPGYNSKSVNPNDVQKWISFMEKQEIKRVCCLLPQNQLNYYVEDLLATYCKKFGHDNIYWVPVEDYHYSDIKTLKKILNFLKESDKKGDAVVVHCSGGSGRTGYVLAAWLVFGRGFAIKEALDSVSRMGRNPYEAINCGNAAYDELYKILEVCQKGDTI